MSRRTASAPSATAEIRQPRSARESSRPRMSRCRSLLMVALSPRGRGAAEMPYDRPLNAEEREARQRYIAAHPEVDERDLMPTLAGDAPGQDWLGGGGPAGPGGTPEGAGGRPRRPGGLRGAGGGF